MSMIILLVVLRFWGALRVDVIVTVIVTVIVVRCLRWLMHGARVFKRFGVVRIVCLLWT